MIEIGPNLAELLETLVVIIGLALMIWGIAAGGN